MRYAAILSAAVLALIPLLAWAEQGPSPEELAGKILEETGIKGGLIVHIGCGDGKLTAALGRREGFLVHGLEGDEALVEKAREHIKSLGLYGRVSVDLWRGDRLPYNDNLVNLAVVEADVDLDELMRVLAPQGVAYIKEGEGWRKVVKPRPKEMDEWTHYLHDASNNAVSRDLLVGPPFHIQWVAGPKWTRSHDHLSSISVVVSSGGRIFYIQDEAPRASVAYPPKWFLVARDAFSGVLLWKRPVGPWEGHLRGFRSGPADLARRLVAVGDRVYVTLGYGAPVTALDAATGEILKVYEGTEGACEIVYDDGVLYVIAGTVDPEEAAQAAARPFGPRPPTRMKRLMAIEAETGRILWTKHDEDTYEIMPTALAVSNGRVYIENTKEVICLDAKSGEVIWRSSRPISLRRPAWSTPTLVVCDGVVLSADRAAPKEAKGGRVEWIVTSRGGDAPPGELIAFSAETGERLWSCPCREGYNSPVDVLVIRGLVWTGNLVRARDPGITAARDLKTGEIKKQRPPDSKFYTIGMGHHRCHRNRATDRYIITGRAGVEFIDIETGRAIPNHWVRGACQYGVLPCNGLLYVPQHSCACYIEAKLSGFYALAPKRKGWSPIEVDSLGDQLEKGPAYDEVVGGWLEGGETEGDWPTYRGDPSRSGYTRSAVPLQLVQLWSKKIGGRLTAPVAAGGRVFVASIDTHTLYALDAESGEVLWSYTAGGRIDSPPTIYKGLVIFGCADGWVYCLRASDGELVWRFRAAPEDRRIVAYDQLESVWPVHGSVLVVNDALYFAAGRSSFLDGGIYLYKLDPVTGERLAARRIDSRDPKTGEEPRGVIKGTDMPGALPDVLSSDGESIFMRHLAFDLDCRPREERIPHLFSPAGFLDDSWWHRTYWIIGTKMKAGWGGWWRVGNVEHSGRLLVLDGENVYGYGRTRYGNLLHIGLGNTRYQLFCASRQLMPPQIKTKGRRRVERSRVRYLWTRRVPVIVRAMILADKTLFIAGPPDILDMSDPAAPIEGRRGGVLRAVSASTGETLAEYQLKSPPVFDGMIAARGKLFISLMNGEVVCLGAGR